MRKLISTLAIIIVLTNNIFSQQWDRHMEVKRMDIQVKSDAFTATTFIEIEFYNPTDKEMEGLYMFQLEPGQAITAFQLELFGQFRDGSIEEKWKARNAYNTIVGKRVDPALLQMDYYNNYSLRIYPVPAKGSRKITMTIQQLLIIDKEAAIYKLPLGISDTIENLQVKISATNSSVSPSVIKGLLTDQVFARLGNRYELTWNAASVRADKLLSFSIPLSLQQPQLCVKNIGDKTFFALRIKPGIKREYNIHPGRIEIFWDVSMTGKARNIAKEISFLKQYVTTNNINQLTIISFNQQIQDTAVFYTGNNFNSRWVEYLQSLQYEGATQLGALDFSTVSADAIFLFSDGKNSYGKNFPKQGQVHVYCINSAAIADTVQLEKIVGKSGGGYIDLTTTSIADAIAVAEKAVNVLLSLSAGGVKIKIDEKVSNVKEDTLLLTGLIPAGADKITLSYGNNGKVNAEEIIAITNSNSCNDAPVERIDVLAVFDNYAKANYPYYWYDVLNFGKQEKIVTQSTSYIVLEKVEDYIKFNITPPKELESKCDMNIFVKADEERRKQYKKLNEFEILNSVAAAYNERITWWDKSQQPIKLTEENKVTDGKGEQTDNKPVKDKTAGAAGATGQVPVIAGTEVIKSMDEVVVTSMGITRQPKELGYSVSRVFANELTQSRSVNLQNGLTGRVSGLNVQTVNNGVFADTRITLRGIRSLTGNNQPLIVLDGSPLDIKLLSSINPNDIQNVTVLKSPSATAIYGPDGVNGALIITTKRGSRYSSYRWSSYRLKDREDVDYLQEMKSASYKQKISQYNELKKAYGYEAGFYFDVAQHLFETGYRKDALTILFSAADISNGNLQVQKAMGYILEGWKEFEEAARLYTELLAANPNDLQLHRNLALAYYQSGNYQKAVDVYYTALTKDQDNYPYANNTFKAMMLQEMNAVITVHKEAIDTSKINNQLIRPLDVDLRVTLDCNTRGLYSTVSIVEPGGKICSYAKPSVNGGHLSQSYNYYYASDVPEEYQVKKALAGKYKLRLSYTDYGGYYLDVKVPTVIKITTFKNFGKPGQTIEIENVIMDNQYGDVEIGEIKW